MVVGQDTKIVEEAAQRSSPTQEDQDTEPVSEDVKDAADPNSKQEKEKDDTQSFTASSTSPRRPLTRSQTGTVAKRRKRDDSEDRAVVKMRAATPRKKQKALSPSEGPSASTSPNASASASPRPPTREPSMCPSSASGGAHPSDTGHQLTFYNASPTSVDQVECRLPRSRATLPTPIPNLTKKSRGRRVPTQPAGASDSDQKDQRLYVCKVDGCGKCFHRGEHLKRHIRSIHTHEKPFKCTFPMCQKYFNRHDNLLQHLKVHRDDIPPSAAANLPAPPHDNHGAPSATRTPPPHHCNQRRVASPPRRIHRHDDPDREGSYDEDPEHSYHNPITHHVTSNPPRRTIYNAFPMPAYDNMNTNPYPTPLTYSSTSDTISRITNMAVSSLRTELPLSPNAASASRPY